MFRTCISNQDLPSLDPMCPSSVIFTSVYRMLVVQTATNAISLHDLDVHSNNRRLGRYLWRELSPGAGPEEPLVVNPYVLPAWHNAYNPEHGLSLIHWAGPVRLDQFSHTSNADPTKSVTNWDNGLYSGEHRYRKLCETRMRS